MKKIKLPNIIHLIAKLIKSIFGIKNFFKILSLISFFLLFSCGDRCIDKDEFYDNQIVVYANPNDVPAGSPRPRVYGEFDPNNGGQYREWQETGLISDGGPVTIWIRGDIVASGGEFANANDLSPYPYCKYCFKKRADITDPDTQNCICGPYIDQNGLYIESEASSPEIIDRYGNSILSSGTNCLNASNANDIDKCTCKTKLATDPPLDSDSYISFSRDMYLKYLTIDPINPDSFYLNFKPSDYQGSCRHTMGYGLYISLWGTDGQTVPQRAYHMFTLTKFCPDSFLITSNCVDSITKENKWVYVYRSPNGRIFQKNDTEFHGENEIIKINYNDQFYLDNKGSSSMQFITGIFQRDDKGLISGIVSTMEDYLFGYQRLENGVNVKQLGVIEFMFKAVLNDDVVKVVVNTGFVIYITFFGLGFFLGIVELNRKEIMLRLLRIGLVTLFTNPSAWLFYNEIVVGFFKDGMNSLCNMIVGLYTSFIELSYIQKITPADAIVSNTLRSSSNFLYVDALIRDLLSDPAGRKIWSLFSMKEGKGFYAIIYVPIIYFLIFYFIYAMIDIAIKYLVNLFKICIGLALGPVFIFLSLFEKTKDMFKNWLAFMGSRCFEIILLFAFIHPFITIIDILFKTILRFKICPEGIGEYGYLLGQSNILKPEDMHTKSLFWWFENFLKLGAMIYITRSVAEKSAYISGQIVSIGGISNADPISEIGKGQTGFSMGSAIVQGAWTNLKAGLNSQYVKGNILKGARMTAKGITNGLRSSGVNDFVNNAFNTVGIRNRGLRSFARDQKIDGFIKEASKMADEKGLEGSKKQEFVRKTTIESVENYKFLNKNYSSLLGLDDKNIQNRLDQKLVKEPLKEFIKNEALKLRSQGIIGKEAQEAIKQKAEDWADKNIFGGQEKVGEFFKKTKIKSLLNKQSNMDVKDAVSYVKYLQERGDKAEDVNKFKEKYLDAVNQNAIRRSLKERKNIEKYGRFGHFGNALSKASNELQKINPFASGLHKSNPKLTARKFDRKLKRTEMDKGSNSFVNKNIINNRGELFPIKKDDSAITKALKAIPNIVGKPISKLIVKPLMNTPDRIRNAKKVAQDIETKYPAVKAITVPTKIVAKVTKSSVAIPLKILAYPFKKLITKLSLEKYVDKVNFKKFAEDKYQDLLKKSDQIVSEHQKNQVESYQRIALQYKPNEDARFRDNRKELEELIKKIDQSPKSEKKTILEKLSEKQRINFQNQINVEILRRKDEILKLAQNPNHDPIELDKLRDTNSKIMNALPNAIFMKLDQENVDKDVLDFVNKAFKIAEAVKDVDSVTFTDGSSSPNVDPSASLLSSNKQKTYGENNLATQILDSFQHSKNLNDAIETEIEKSKKVTI